MIKITFIGAGSTVFVRNVIGGIMRALRTIPVMEAFAHEKDGVDLYPEIKKRAAAMC